MPVSHALVRNPSPAPFNSPAFVALQGFLTARREAGPVNDFERLEIELRAMVNQVELEVLASELAKLDVDVRVVEIEGDVARQVVRCQQEYFTAAGKVRVTRSLYRVRGSKETECPLELQSGMVAGRWTPLAAKQVGWVIGHLTPGEGAQLFSLMGGMSPSSSSLDRLPKKIGARWEADRKDFDQLLREEEVVPPEAVTVAVGLDGVMVPVNDPDSRGKGCKAGDQRGRQGQRPGTHREAACAAISFYDADGERLRTIRFARMPERKKLALKTMILEEVGCILAQRPDLKLVKVADGALDNWEFLERELPGGAEVLDFYHASQHLRDALELAHGPGSAKAAQQYETLRLKLRDERSGVDSVIRALRYLCGRHPAKRKLATELTYFRNNRHRMNYAVLLDQNLPIGSGVIEASCKTLVTQRLKRSGMRWSQAGGQAILLLRSLVQSQRFDRAWEILVSTYKRKVTIPADVLEFPTRRAS